MKFDSTFECGNGAEFKEESESLVSFVIEPDSRSDDRQWFYFSVEGAAGREVTFNLKNAADTNCPSHWVHARPVCSSDGGATWERIAQPGTYDHDKGVYTFVHRVKSDRELIAYHYPYSYSDHLRKMDEWGASPLIQREEVGKSLSGRPIEMLRCGNSEDPQFGFWFTARQHSAETPASFVMEGFVDFLISDDERAAKLRKIAAINMVPMINPDGVYMGNYRDNAAGVNLNRVWNVATTDESPEVLGVTKAVADWVNGGKPYQLFVDFHADSTAREHYVFHPAREICAKKSIYGDGYYHKVVEYLNHVAGHSPEFLPAKFASYNDTRGVSYRYMLDTYNVLGMIPEGGYSDITHGQLAGTWLAPENHRRVGRGFALGLYEMFVRDGE